ncbi:patatin-like phospholipase family protein [Nonomuraea sp. G32]|nr:patatin-like phospholipase family protein [Nonomuraea sp. G32]MDP4510590.1 patatin-like phospholipase family protein [Nonomuraea sp. G32]
MRQETAVVLGPGGMLGTAWLAGLAAGLRREGFDLAKADLTIGTSAGAIVGATLAAGQDLERLAVLPEADGEPAVKTDHDRLNEVFAILGDSTLEPAAALRRVGRLALAAETGAEEAHLARMEFLIGASEWPEGRLLIPAVDVDTGEPLVWEQSSGVSLVAAVASSSAFPASAPPITINGRRYMDGALRSGTNADLAAGIQTVIVIEPLAHLFPANMPHHATAVRLAPDPAAQEVLGDLNNRAAWSSVYHAGARQAAEAAKLIEPVWVR